MSSTSSGNLWCLLFRQNMRHFTPLLAHRMLVEVISHLWGKQSLQIIMARMISYVSRYGESYHQPHSRSNNHFFDISTFYDMFFTKEIENVASNFWCGRLEQTLLHRCAYGEDYLYHFSIELQYAIKIIEARFTPRCLKSQLTTMLISPALYRVSWYSKW